MTFIQAENQKINIQISPDHLLKSYNGYCLIQTSLEKFAFWLPEHTIINFGENLEITIDRTEDYTASILHSLLSHKPSRLKKFTGNELIKLLSINGK